MVMRRLSVLAACAAALCLPALLAQVGAGGGPGGTILTQPPGAAAAPADEGRGAISGVVLDAATKTPLEGAIVQLSSGPGAAGIQQRQLTDAKGRFAFPNLPSGSTYAIAAGLFGYLDGGYGRGSGVGASAPIAVREGEWVQDVRVLLSRPSSISGAVIDERGEPVVGAFVRALVRARIGGRDRLLAGPLTTTDDRGVYRLAGLIPGHYLIEVPSVQATAPATEQPGDGRGGGSAIPSATEPALEVDGRSRLLLREFPAAPADAGRAMVYPPTFFPGSRTVSGASGIDLEVGEERTGVDVSMQAVPAWRVSGVVQGPPAAISNLTLRLLGEGLESLGYGSETATSLVGSDGRFTFLNVPEGSYVLDAPRTFTELTSSAAGFGSSMSVGMGGPAGFPRPPTLGRGWSMSSYSLDNAPAGVSISTSNFRGTPPGYFARMSITVAGHDEDGVVVRMQPTGTLSGRVILDTDPARPAGTNAPTFGIRLEPASGDPALGRLAVEGPPNPAATEFTITGLLPGEYVLRGPMTVKAVTWRGRDYTDQPFDAAETPDITGVEVTLTNAAPVLSGTVRDAQGAPAEAAFVIAFPTSSALRSNGGFTPVRIRSTTASRAGAYRFTALPAGEYFVVAIEGSRANWHEPEFMQSAEPMSARVSLDWGRTSTADLVVKAVR